MGKSTMPNTLSMITSLFQPTNKADEIAEKERAVDEAAAELKRKTEARRERNSETRTNMQRADVQDGCPVT